LQSIRHHKNQLAFAGPCHGKAVACLDVFGLRIDIGNGIIAAMITTENLRCKEMESVASFFTHGMRILELGGGNGYQASLLAGLGVEIKSIDIAPKNNGYFPVDIYDGQHIPFPDACFDAVFSSNVLEHIKDVDAIMVELSRILKPNRFFNTSLCAQKNPVL
jgi:ubiquinone/menaquinone biosynthesis C-methylase UbiE